LDPRSDNNNKETGEKNCCFNYFLVLQISQTLKCLIFQQVQKKFEPIEFKYFFYPKNCYLPSSQKYGLGIQDPDSCVKKHRIPDPDLRHSEKLNIRKMYLHRVSLISGGHLGELILVTGKAGNCTYSLFLSAYYGYCFGWIRTGILFQNTDPDPDPGVGSSK
jgi:hypothetical protein